MSTYKYSIFFVNFASESLYTGMKRLIVIVLAFMMPLMAQGQAQINTKKVKIGDFTEKITKVVLTGKGFMDGALKDEVTVRWRISPYEFCTMEEFESLKTNDDYYFLMTTSGQFKKDSGPTIQFLTLVKGGSGAEKGINGMLEIVSMPIASAQFPSGRELMFLPAFLDIIQKHTLEAMEKDANAYGGLANSAARLSSKGDRRIVFSEEDICGEISEELAASLDSKGIMIVGEDEADEFFGNESEDTIVSYVVAPYDGQPGSFCYKMLIDSQSHTLYYFKRHRIGKNSGKGFLPEDLKRICASVK